MKHTAWGLAFACATALAQAPGEVELEMWRSAARLDTAAAYQAYLAAYPRGTFEPMARAALAKLQAAAPAAAGPASPAPAPEAAPAAPRRSATLAPFGRGVNSGAADLAESARLQGPGIVIVGRTGARRQVVLPQGEWVLLAAEDHRTGTTVQFSLTSLAFGRFDGARLVSLLVATSSTRPVTVGAGSPGTQAALGVLPRWVPAERCEVPTPQDVTIDIGSDRWMRRCAALRRAGDWRAQLQADVPPLAEALDEALKTAGAQVPGFAYRSEWQLTDTRYAWLGIVRWDVDGPAAPRQAFLKAYTAAAAKGMLREWESEPLQPGVVRPDTQIQLPD